MKKLSSKTRKNYDDLKGPQTNSWKGKFQGTSSSPHQRRKPHCEFKI